MSKPTFSSPLLNRWVAEHEAALAQLERMDWALGRNWNTVRAGASWLFSELKQHNEAEERLLFPALEAATGPNGPTAVMRAEHRELWALEERLVAVLETGHPGDPADAEATARALIQGLSAHIQKENRVLYPLAERVLGRDVLGRIGKAS